MTTETKILLGSVAGVAVLILLLWTTTEVSREIAPEPKAAWVAVEVGESGLAKTGLVQVSSGTPFRLHAVVEAETLTGRRIYYTEAKRLEIGGKEIPPATLRLWRRALKARILWFTVEGYRPYLEIGSVEDLQQFRFEELFRADWPRGWSIPGDLRPAGQPSNELVRASALPQFGTQRFHVRVEFFGPESEIAPRLRLLSLRAADLPAEADSFTTVIASLPGALEQPSSVFGLTQVEPAEGLFDQVADQIYSWTSQRIAFSRLSVLGQWLERSDSTYEQLEWLSLDLGEKPPWNDVAAPGDLLRVGDRWVVLLRDEGEERILDREDLCLDYDKGTRVRRLGEVFTGEGLIQWARLS